MMKAPRVHLTAIAYGILALSTVAFGFQIPRKLSLGTRGSFLLSTYGRGAEIWPECNEEVVQLATSFPNGDIPAAARIILDETSRIEAPLSDETPIESSKLSKRQRASDIIRKILNRAAAKEELDSEEQTPKTNLDRLPSIVALLLVFGGLVKAQDLMLASCLTAYLVILGMVANSPREFNGVPILPALPPQAHVPAMVSNPLGNSLSSSPSYDRWLKAGVFLGILGPICLIGRYLLSGDMQAARVCSRPLFLLCVQALSEAFSRRVLAPLPIRILVPIMYNTARLYYLWTWLSSAASLGLLGRAFAICNGLYWGLNLFAFLIPIASMRYARAHFFGVEAAEVATRKDLVETFNLIPRP